MPVTVLANQQPTPTIPQTVGNKRGVGLTAATLLASIVVPVDGSYLVSGNIRTTGGTTYSFGIVAAFTDETGQVGTRSIPMMVGGIVVVAANADGFTSYSGIAIQIRAKAGTTLSVSTVGTFTSAIYNAEAQITKISD